MAVQYCKPLVIFEIRGALSHPSTTSPADTALKALKPTNTFHDSFSQCVVGAMAALNIIYFPNHHSHVS
jgi:hypothetical protein